MPGVESVETWKKAQITLVLQIVLCEIRSGWCILSLTAHFCCASYGVLDCASNALIHKERCVDIL